MLLISLPLSQLPLEAVFHYVMEAHNNSPCPEFNSNLHCSKLHSPSGAVGILTPPADGSWQHIEVQLVCSLPVLR